MIADEVICGFGRTGNMWGCETFDIEPDSMSVAKQLSSAYQPISGIMVNDRIFDVVDQSKKIGTFAPGFTYSAHPVAAAVALRTMQLMEERKIMDHVREIAPVMQKRLDSPSPIIRWSATPAVSVWSVPSSWWPIQDGQAVQSEADGRCLLHGPGQEHGLITRAMGDALGFCPPLVITAEEINLMFDSFEKALDDTTLWVEKEGLRAAADRDRFTTP